MIQRRVISSNSRRLLSSSRNFNPSTSRHKVVHIFSSPFCLPVSCNSKSAQIRPCSILAQQNIIGSLTPQHRRNDGLTNLSLHQVTISRSKVFVSKHNQSLNVTSNQITDYCNNHGFSTTDLRTTNAHVILRECPFCPKPTAGKADNMFKLYVQIGGGAYFCHRCGAKGSWYDFKMKLGGFEVVDALGRSTAPTSSPMGHAPSPRNIRGSGGGGGGMDAPLPMPSQRLQAAYITNLMDGKEMNEKVALAYLTNKRGLTKQTLRKYGVGLGVYNFPSNEPGQHGRYMKADCITFPWIMRASQIHIQESLRGSSYRWETETDTQAKEKVTISKEEDAADGGSNQDEDSRASVLAKDGPFVTRRIKARALDNKSWQRLDPPGGGWGLFGWHTIPPNATEIVLTEGEYDAMAVFQATGRPAISLPNGCRSLPVEVLPMLERFEKIFLWMDNDVPGREGAEQFAKKIGINRCYLVQPNPSKYGDMAPKDANDALLHGFDLDELIMDAEISPHERILSFGDLRSQVLHEIRHPDKYRGVGVPSLPDFTNIIKGFRRGELTVRITTGFLIS